MYRSMYATCKLSYILIHYVERNANHFQCEHQVNQTYNQRTKIWLDSPRQNPYRNDKIMKMK